MTPEEARIATLETALQTCYAEMSKAGFFLSRFNAGLGSTGEEPIISELAIRGAIQVARKALEAGAKS